MENQYCQNCHHPIKGKDKYCSNCGQKNIIGRIRFLDLMKDFLNNLFNWDSKIFITPLMLFKPGFLTSEFFKGRRKRYTNPGRLLLSTLIIYFALVMFSVKDGFEGMDEGNSFKQMEYFYSYVDENQDTLQTYLENKYDGQKIEGITDTIKSFVIKDVGGMHMNIFNMDISSKDFIMLNEEELFEKYKVEGFFYKLLFKQIKKLFETPGGYIQYVISRSSWVILLSVPFLSIFMALLYIRQKRFYVEHVVFLMHVNAFIFILGIIFFLFSSFISGTEPFSLLPYVFGTIYIFPAMKIFYGQGYRKTFIKYMAVTIASFWVFMVLGSLMFLVGILLF